MEKETIEGNIRTWNPLRRTPGSLPTNFSITASFPYPARTGKLPVFCLSGLLFGNKTSDLANKIN